MASSLSKKSETHRPHPLNVSRSFSRAEPVSQSNASRGQRASTIQNGIIAEGFASDRSNAQAETKIPRMQPDAFGKSPEGVEYHEFGDVATGKLPADFDQLPIELVSLTDRSVLPIPEDGLRD